MIRWLMTITLLVGLFLPRPGFPETGSPGPAAAGWRRGAEPAVRARVLAALEDLGARLADPLVEAAARSIRADDRQGLARALTAAVDRARLHPDDIAALMTLGRILVLMDNNEDINLMADGIFTRIVGLEPDNDRAWRYLADIRYRSGLYHSVLTIAEPRVRSGRWLDERTVGLLVLSYVRDDNCSHGLDFLGALVRQYPDRIFLRLQRAILAHHAGDKGLARRELRAVLDRPGLPVRTRKLAADLMTMNQEAP